MKTRKRYFIGIPDHMNNCWWLGSSALNKKEAEDKLMAELNKPENFHIQGAPIKNTYIEEYSEDEGWDIVKVLKGWD